MGGQGGVGGSAGGGGMACLPGEEMACYSGPPGTAGMGACKEGVQTCNAQGSGYGLCFGETIPSPESCATLADEDCDGNGGISCPGGVWGRVFGDAGAQAGFSVTSTPAGEVLLAGRFGGSVNFGGGALQSAGELDVFVAKLDASSGHLWSRQLFGDEPNEDRTPSIAADAAGGVVLTSGFTTSVDMGAGVVKSAGDSDILLAKYDAAGNHVWSKHFGDASSQIPRGIAVDPAGHTIVAGSFEGTVDFGGGPLTALGIDVFVAKFDAAGGHVFSKRLGGALVDDASAVAVDASGNILLAGHFEGNVDFGGGPLTSAGGADIFVLKLNPSGAHVWSKAGGGDVTSFVDLAAGPSGEVIAGGYSQAAVDFGGGPLVSAGSLDIFIAKLDANGGHAWSYRFGDAAAQLGLGVAVDAGGNAAITGRFKGAADFGLGPLVSAGGDDVFVAKLAPSGSPLWSQRYGEMLGQNGRDVAFDAAGYVLITGWMSGTADFGSGPLLGAGGTDVLLARLAP